MIYLPLEDAKKCIKFMRKRRQGRQLLFGQEGSTLEGIQSFVHCS